MTDPTHDSTPMPARPRRPRLRRPTNLLVILAVLGMFSIDVPWPDGDSEATSVPTYSCDVVVV